MRGLIVRKTRRSITQSAMVTFERKVLHPLEKVRFHTTQQAYLYPNGSELVVGGLDKASKVMSMEYDMAYVQEAIELTEDDWESITTRLRYGVMPYQQLIADTNPDRENHWLNRRGKTGKTKVLESRHEDNPTLWDKERQAWTKEGAAYIAKLDALTGVRYKRLRKGLWVQAEGQIYDEYDPAIHLIDRFDIPYTWPRYLVVDFGFTNPFVAQWWAEDLDGRLFRYREIYMTQRLVEDHAKQTRALCAGEPLPEDVICDHDAEGRATLAKYLGMSTTPAHKAVSEGIQAVQSRLKVAGDGRARLYLLRDSLVERDEARAEAKLPTCTEEEVDGYVWNLKSGRNKGEEPVKENDHGMDAARYMVAHRDLRGGLAFEGNTVDLLAGFTGR